jgi:voltage-gated potassium channel
MTKDQRQALLRRVEHATDAPMLVLSVAFLVIFVLPELVRMSPAALEMLNALGWFIWGVFALELLIKIYLAPKRMRYLLVHWVDVLTVIVPFLRPLRLLRVAVVIVRLWDESRTMLRRRTFSVIGLSSLLLVFAAALGVYIAEREAGGSIASFSDAVWWSVTTITTVGYGDTYPTTPTGRGIAVLLMLAGISLFGLLTARIAAFFVEEEATTSPELAEVLERLARIEQQNADLQNQLEHRDD